MLPQMLRPGGGHQDKRAASRRMMTRDEASIVGVFPHGQARTRRSPHLEHVGVGAGVGPHPLEEVEDQGIDSAGHGGPCGLAQVGQYIASLSRLTKASLLQGDPPRQSAAEREPQQRGLVGSTGKEKRYPESWRGVPAATDKQAVATSSRCERFVSSGA